DRKHPDDSMHGAPPIWPRLAPQPARPHRILCNSGGRVVAARRHMRLPRRLVERGAVLLVAVALAACSTNIRDLNLRPEKHYQQKVTVVGYITRMQSVGSETL